MRNSCLNGGFLCSSSVVSLSSCESELHALTSSLCDGIYLRRCIEFLVDSEIDHFLLVDSSSARQIAMRLGPGKLKHVLWIQQAVVDGAISLVQVPTVWNLGDVGTKPWRQSPASLVAWHQHGQKEGAEAIGSEEYEVQVRKHGSGKHLNALARNIARVIMMMGLESGSGAFAMPIF